MPTDNAFLTALGDYWPLAAAAMLAIGALALGFNSLREVSRSSGALRRLHASEGIGGVFGARANGLLASLFSVSRKVGEKLAPDTGRERGDLQKRLRQAGLPSGEAAALFYGGRALMMLGLPVLALMLANAYSAGLPPSVYVIAAAAAAGLGFIVPSFLLDLIISSFRKEMRLGFPDMLDLLVICLESGMSFDSAFERVSDELDSAYPRLRQVMEQTTRELRAGKERSAALFAFAERVSLEEATAFANMILQAEQLGSGITRALRICADEMRDKRLMRAEEYANALPVLLTIPLGGFIFPAMLVVVLLPACFSVAEALFGYTP